MNGAGNLKILCDSAEILQERIRRFPNEVGLLAAVRAVGIPDPAALLAYARSASVERQSCYVLVPVLWDVGDLSHYHEVDSDDASLLKIDQQLAHDSIGQSRLFHSAGNRFMSYLTSWAQELNRRGDEMFLQYRCDEEGLTRGLPRLADIKLNGTIMDRMKAEIDCLPGTAEGSSCGMGSGALDATAPSEEGSYQVEGRRFYLDIEAQELGSALCLAGQVAGV